MIKLSFVRKRILSITLALFSLYLFNTGCSKLDTTDIGTDLLPAVDNVHTFETTLPVTTTQGIFTSDTTTVTRTEDQVLGKINNDPLFGTTRADIYAQFKPTFFPFYWGNASDTIVGLDSVVLCLSYKGFWGDSTVPMQIDVKTVANNAGDWDTIGKEHNVNFIPPTASTIGSALINFSNLNNWVVYTNKKDSARNHIRIKLSSAFANALFARDTLVAGNNSFRSDSAFKLFLNGIAITASGAGNGLMYTNFSDSMTRLEVHYRRKKGTSSDTTFSALRVLSFNGVSTSVSATANNIVRNRAGFPVSVPSPDYIYLQTSPGTYANLKIPALDTLSNRIVHRAEIIIEQVPNNFLQDSLFSAPDFLYVDLVDTGTAKWKPIYFDLNPSSSYDPDYKTAAYFPSGGIDYFYHGGFARYKLDVFNNTIRTYNFNITRHVQQIVTKHTPNYTIRLFAPYTYTYPQFSSGDFLSNNRIAKGRVRVGSGTNANYRMRLHIVYSKI